MAFDPDAYLASKTSKSTFDPDAYLASKGISASEDNPTELGSFGRGVMSGIPGAETAISGVGSMVTDKSYEDIHKRLEDLKDKDWEVNPKSYGAGKVTGIVGTGMVAPEILPELGVENAIGQAAVQGAGYGADLASKPSDLPMDVAKGAGTGAVTGVIGEKVLSPLINKIPGVAQKAVTALVPGENAAAAVETRLTTPEVLSGAKSPAQAADTMESLMNNIKAAAGHLSEKAKATLSPSSMVDMNEITPIIEGARQNFLTSGTAAGGANESALNEINKWAGTLDQIASQNGGRIPDTTMAELIRDIRGNANYNPMTATATTDSTNSALKMLGHGFDTILKNKNDAYRTAMEPVAELTDLSKKVAKNFNITKVTGGGMEATDATSGKLANITKDNKTNAQEVLQKFSDLTGYDFMGNANNFKLNEAFGAGKSTPAINNALTMLGYGVGHQTNVPMGGLAGAAAARIMGREVDGGAIAASIIDSWMNPSSVLGEARAAVEKFGPILANAAKAGGNSLAATHFVLSTSNPEYQNLINKTQENAGQ